MEDEDERSGLWDDTGRVTAYCSLLYLGRVHYTPYAVGLESSLGGWEPSSNNIVG